MDDPAGPLLIGRAPAFRDAIGLSRKLAMCDATVLVYGETGTGKELVARALHYWGPRRAGPFIPVNCGAISDTLFESEFYGYERGAFTDARTSRAGLVAQASSGCLFLDEIEALTSRGQVALLRFLQDREYRPVGASKPRVADVRVIAASNRDLAGMVRSGIFREDLFFRLTVFGITLPPLRERPGDATLLAAHFVEGFARQYRLLAKQISPEMAAHLERHSWPGNVRELESFVHREFLLGEGPLLGSAGLPGAEAPASGVDGVERFRSAKARAVAAFEKAYLADVLARTGGNLTRAARLAGKERSALSKLVRKHGISRDRLKVS